MRFKKAVFALGLTTAVAFGQQTGTGSSSSNSQGSTDNSSSSHGSHSAGSSASTGSGSMVNPMDRRFMMEAAQGGMAEVQLAQLAQQKGSSDAVKQYAKMLEQDHTKANDELKQVAQQKSVDLPTDVGPKHHAMMQKFQGLSGEQFDRAYVKMMVLDHKKDIKDFQRQADRGMDSDVKGFASKTLPTLQGHLKEVEQLASNKGSGSGSMGTRSRSDSGSSSSGQDSSAQPKSQNNPTPQP